MHNIHFEDETKSQNPAKGASTIPQSLGTFGPAIELRWPTDYRVITQPFGVNPELQNGPSGHEGLDIRAPSNSKVYASADGVVESIHLQANGNPHGHWVRIAHQDGYGTAYGHLGNIVVSKGEKVRRGAVIGYSAKTGQTSGGHIHFSLFKAGATSSGLTHLPDDMIDPTPFLSFNESIRDASDYPWAFGKCLKGVNCESQDRVEEIVEENSAEAVLLDMEIGKELINKLRVKRPTLFLMTQLKLPTTRKSLNAAEWAAWVTPKVEIHARAGVGYFSVLSLPNTVAHGLGLHWDSGKGFGRWWAEAVSLLKTHFPSTQFGFPALSIGNQVTGQRMDSEIFIEEADEAALSADWLGIMCNWSDPKKMQDETQGQYYSKARLYYPDHLLFVMDYGFRKGPGYAAESIQVDPFLDDIKTVPGIGAAFARI